MNKLAGVINSMNYSELKAIQKDLAEGNMGRLIKAKIDQTERTLGHDERVCPTCGALISEATSKYTLVFGPEDFKKKALFDEIDCLSFFIDKLKEQRADLKSSEDLS
jgi:hypothetical protein